MENDKKKLDEKQEPETDMSSKVRWDISIEALVERHARMTEEVNRLLVLNGQPPIKVYRL
jgi:hypothetical protein